MGAPDDDRARGREEEPRGGAGRGDARKRDASPSSSDSSALSSGSSSSGSSSSSSSSSSDKKKRKRSKDDDDNEGDKKSKKSKSKSKKSKSGKGKDSKKESKKASKKAKKHKKEKKKSSKKMSRRGDADDGGGGKEASWMDSLCAEEREVIERANATARAKKAAAAGAANSGAMSADEAAKLANSNPTGVMASSGFGAGLVRTTVQGPGGSGGGRKRSGNRGGMTMNFPGARGASYDGNPTSGGARNQPNEIAQRRLQREKKAQKELRTAAAMASTDVGARIIASAPSTIPTWEREGPSSAPLTFAPGLHKF